MLTLARPDVFPHVGDDGLSSPEAGPETGLPAQRSVYGASRGTKPEALLITLVIHAIALTALVLKFSSSYTVAKPSAALVVTLLPPASPPEPDHAEKEKPVPERKTEAPPTPQRIEPIQHTLSPHAPAMQPPPLDIPRIDPAPRQTETAAPKATPAPPAPQQQSNAPDSWEGRVLARLEKFRRYPGAARSARQQGIAYIRFRIGRDGHVLSSALARSSGFPALDHAALETLRRADPLPKIPTDRPDEIELAVPVEFYIR